MGKQDNRVYEFADFRLETAERILSRDGKVIPLRPKLFDLLVFLIEHRGEILEKDEITRAVWGGHNHGSVEKPDANLNVNVSNLRHALGDDPDKPRFIETVQRRGYRFIALVKTAETLIPDIAATWPGPAAGGEFAFQPPKQNEDTRPDNQNERGASTPTVSESVASGRRGLIFIIALSILLLMALLLGWAIVKPGSSARRTEIVHAAPNGPAEKSSGGAQAGLAAALQPRIHSLEPATPLALIGDQPIKITGSGFQPGMTVTMLFPSGGSGYLSGEQLREITREGFFLVAAFNNNPGHYRIRLNAPDGMHSEWFAFRVVPINLSPEIAEVKQGALENGVQRITVNGRNFQQNVGVVLIRPDGRPDYPQSHRTSETSFDLLFEPRGQTGPFKLQAQNPSGKNSNVVSFSISTP